MRGLVVGALLLAAAFAAPRTDAAPLTPSPVFGLPAWVEGEWQVDVAVSGDGRHLYFAVDGFFAHTGTGTLYKRGREPASGFYLPGSSVTTPADPQGIALSRDDRHLYAALPGADAIYHYERDPDTGDLTEDDSVTDGVGGVDGIGGVRDLVVSPDDRHVYAVGDENAVAVFARDLVTGALTFVERERDGQGGVDGLDGAIAVAIAPDGRHVYVASDLDDAVAVFARNAGSGALTYVEDRRDGVAGFDGLDGATAIAVSRDGGGVFVAGQAESKIAVLGRDPATGSLSFSEIVADGTRGVSSFATPTAFALDTLRPRLLAASRSGTGSGALVLFDYDPAARTLTRSHQISAAAESIAVTPDGRHVYRAGQIETFTLTSLGPLAFVDALSNGEAGTQDLDGPHALALAGKHLLATASVSGALASFERTGSGLAFVERERDGIGDVDGLGAADGVARSPDGRHVYATGWVDDAITVFALNASSGALSFVEVERDGVGGADGMNGASGVAVSPDGKHVYVASRLEDSLAAFARDAATGTLAFVEVERNGVGGVEGLNGAKGVAVSRDGENVYVASPIDDAVAVFARDATTGALTYVEVERDGVGGVSGLAGADDVAPSPDGAHVYVIAQQGVVAFGRAPSNGALSFVQQPYLGPAFVSQGSSLAISPDGSYLLATSPVADELVVFWCDPATGLLGLAQRERDGIDGASGMLGAVGVALDARNAYVSGEAGDAIAIFAPEPSAAALGAAALLSVGALRRRRGGSRLSA